MENIETYVYQSHWSILLKTVITIILLFKEGSHYVFLAVLELCRVGWPQTHRDLAIFAYKVWGLKVCTIVPGYYLFLIKSKINYTHTHIRFRQEKL